MAGEATRKSNIELARIISILCVIVLHYNNASRGGGFAYVVSGTFNNLIMNVFESCSIFAVDLFILISGYFMITSGKRGLFKPLSLFIQFVIFKLLFLGINIVMGSASFSLVELGRCFLPNDWFINLYIVLFCISPFINLAINRLSDRHQMLLLGIVIVFFSVEPTVVDVIGAFSGQNLDHMTFIGLSGSQGGYSIVQFVLMYVIGGILRLQEKNMVSTSKKMPLLIYVLCVVLTLMLSVFTDLAFEYCCPFVVIEAISVFMIFRDMDLKPSKVINGLAKGTFSIYLVHSNLYRFFNIEYFVNRSTPVYIGHTILTVLAIYIISYVLYLIYDLCTKAVLKMLKNSLAKFEYDIPQ